MQKLKVSNYVISLASAKERRDHIIQEFSIQNIPFIFFDALTPINDLQQSIKQFMPDLQHSKLSGGEKGCLMSHFMLWKKCIDKNLPYISIFEDDILLGENAGSFLSQDNWLKERFDFDDIFIIKLETFLMATKRNMQTDVPEYAERHFEVLKSSHFGTAGYVISNGGAKYLINLFAGLSVEKIEPIDELIFNSLLSRNKLTVYQLNPALCIQEQQMNGKNSQLFSQLQHERKLENDKSKPEKNFKQRIIRIKENIYRAITKSKRNREKEQQEEVRIRESVPFL